MDLNTFLLPDDSRRLDWVLQVVVAAAAFFVFLTAGLAIFAAPVLIVVGVYRRWKHQRFGTAMAVTGALLILVTALFAVGIHSNSGTTVSTEVAPPPVQAGP